MKKEFHNIKPEESLGGLIGQAGRSMMRALQGQFKALSLDITVDQWIVLMHLWEEDGQNQATLGETAGHHKTTVTRAIDSLERQNMVLRVPDKSDRRNKLIYLTHLGREMQASLMQPAILVHEEAVSDIDEADLATCKAVLAKIFQNLKHHI
jgi:DNA-binding MarR family transcriptional regulator